MGHYCLEVILCLASVQSVLSDNFFEKIKVEQNSLLSELSNIHEGSGIVYNILRNFGIQATSGCSLLSMCIL